MLTAGVAFELPELFVAVSTTRLLSAPAELAETATVVPELLDATVSALTVPPPINKTKLVIPANTQKRPDLYILYRVLVT